MQIRFDSARHETAVRGLLRADGWELEGPVTGAFWASHAEAADQSSARSRLQQLGLLTSARLRIEFDSSPRGRPGPGP